MRRREFLVASARAAGLAAIGALGCDSGRPRAGFLGAMERVNERFQRALFDPTRLAPELAQDDETPLAEFPRYKIGLDYPEVPAGWALKVGGLVQRPLSFSLDALERLPRTRTRVRHHCVEGWSAVAAWDGVRVPRSRGWRASIPARGTSSSSPSSRATSRRGISRAGCTRRRSSRTG